MMDRYHAPSGMGNPPPQSRYSSNGSRTAALLSFDSWFTKQTKQDCRSSMYVEIQDFSSDQKIYHLIDILTVICHLIFCKDLFLLSGHYILINDSICCCQPPFNIPESSDAKMESLGMRKLLPYPILKRTGRSTMVHQSRILRLNNLLYKQLFLCTLYKGVRLLSKMTMTMLTLFFFWMSFLCSLFLLHLLLMM